MYTFMYLFFTSKFQWSNSDFLNINTMQMYSVSQKCKFTYFIIYLFIYF